MNKTKEQKVHKQDGYFLVICDNCNTFVKGTSEKQAIANVILHKKSKFCKEEGRAKRLFGGLE